MLRDSEWQQAIWADALSAATAETGLEDLPEPCPWSTEQILDPDWLPQD